MELPRFCVGLQDEKDTSLYKDVLDTNSLSEAKKLALELVEEHKRTSIVFERPFGIIIKNKPDSTSIQKEVEEKSIQEPEKRKRGRPKKIVETNLHNPKNLSKDAFFDD